MPKVTKRKAAKVPRKPARKKAAPSLFERLGFLTHRYTVASVAGALVLLAGGAGVMWAGGYVGLLTERAGAAAKAGAVASGFQVRQITLIGRGNTSADDLQKAIGPVLGQSLLHLDLEAARARVESLGWVRAASVSRLLPDSLHVSIRERSPAAVWQMSGKLHLIDVEGAVIQEIDAYQYSSLPLVVGAGAPGAAADLLQALASHPEIVEMTAALVRVSERRWNLRLRNGLDVKLPDAGFDEALGVLSVLHRDRRALDQSLEYIDLRDPDRMVLHKRGEPAEKSIPTP